MPRWMPRRRGRRPRRSRPGASPLHQSHRHRCQSPHPGRPRPRRMRERRSRRLGRTRRAPRSDQLGDHQTSKPKHTNAIAAGGSRQNPTTVHGRRPCVRGAKGCPDAGGCKSAAANGFKIRSGLSDVVLDSKPTPSFSRRCSAGWDGTTWFDRRRRGQLAALAA
jgi:hypothetical protein